MSPTGWPEGSTAALSNWSPTLVAGPYWPSFEQLRTGGTAALEGINLGSVGTLRTKSSVFRIMRDDDFQKLLGLASEVHRLKAGITFVVQAAKVVAKHKDQESIELFFQSVSMLSESRVLPQRDGHDQFVITPEEAAQNTEQGYEPKAADIPRPKL
jgi:hypothetical protein